MRGRACRVHASRSRDRCCPVNDGASRVLGPRCRARGAGGAFRDPGTHGHPHGRDRGVLQLGRHLDECECGPGGARCAGEFHERERDRGVGGPGERRPRSGVHVRHGRNLHRNPRFEPVVVRVRWPRRAHRECDRRVPSPGRWRGHQRAMDGHDGVRDSRTRIVGLIRWSPVLRLRGTLPEVASRTWAPGCRQRSRVPASRARPES